MAIETHSYDVLVIGGGPGGIAAACAASETGASVAVVDASPTAGGQIWRGGLAKTTCRIALPWLRRFDESSATFFPNVQIVADGGDKELVGVRNDTTVRFAYKSLVLATGAREVFIPFPGWTTPGVLGAGGIQAALKSGLDIRGKRVLIAGSGPLLLAVASTVKTFGGSVVAVAEQAPMTSVLKMIPALVQNPFKLMQAARYRMKLLGSPYLTNHYPTAVEKQESGLRVSLQSPRGVRELECDYLACGFHLTPNLELPRLLGCAVTAGIVHVDDRMQTSKDSIFAVGELLGIGGVDCALLEGQIAGLTATGDHKMADALAASQAKARRLAKVMNDAFELREELRRVPLDDTIVCRCEDVAHGDLKDRAGWREAKLYTRCGMGPCQGRVCGTSTDVLYGWTNDSVRPPLFPVPTTFWAEDDA